MVLRKSINFLIALLLIFRVLAVNAEEQLRSISISLDNYAVQESFGATSGDFEMVVKAGSVVEGAYQYFSLNAPDRLVLDFSGLVAREGKVLPVSSNPFIKQIRIGSHPSKTRVVFDLTEKARGTYSVVQQDKAVLFVFKLSKGEKKGEAPAKSKPAPKLIGSLPLSLDRVIVYFPHYHRPIQNVVVTNQSSSAVSVWTKSEVIKRPGFQDQSRSETDRLFISPKRFSLAPGSERTVRLVLDGKAAQQEEVFRISFIPQLHDDSEPLDSINIKAHRKAPAVIAGVGVLAFAQPPKVSERLDWIQKDNLLRLINSGNVNILLEQGRMCVPEMEKCFQLPVTRLYAGNEWAIRVPTGSFLEFLKKVGEKKNEIITISSS